MKVIIAGTRNHSIEPDKIQELIEKSGLEITELVCGMATGVDISAKFWAEKNDVPIKKFHPEWAVYGRKAGPLRNEQMAQYADALIAVWDGRSRGTSNMIQTMKGHGKRTIIFKYQ